MPPKEIFALRTANEAGRSWTDAGQSVREQIQYICETTQPTGHQREMSFLRHLMRHDETGERQRLEEKLTQTERNEQCVRRAVWLAALLTGLALAGLGYSAIFFEDFSQDRRQLLTRIFCALGMASLISALTFAAVWLISRAKLDDVRDECRRLVTRIVESRLGKPTVASSAKSQG